MRGEVLEPDDAGGGGVILGENGERYDFTAAQVHKAATLPAGAAVDFMPLGREARDIFIPPVKAPGKAAARAALPAAASPVQPGALAKYFWRSLTRDYFQFKGRARRSEYWSFVFFQFLTIILLYITDVLFEVFVFERLSLPAKPYFPALTMLFVIYSVMPSIAVAVRRLHDRGLSGWMYLTILIPYVGFVGLIIRLCLDSRREPNKHGPSPKYSGGFAGDVFN